MDNKAVKIEKVKAKAVLIDCASREILRCRLTEYTTERNPATSITHFFLQQLDIVGENPHVCILFIHRRRPIEKKNERTHRNLIIGDKPPQFFTFSLPLFILFHRRQGKQVAAKLRKRGASILSDTPGHRKYQWASPITDEIAITL